MTDLVSRAAGLFVVRADDAATPPRAVVTCRGAAVVGAVADAVPVAAAAALRAATDGGAACVAVWTPGGWSARRGSATAAARRSASELAHAGLGAAARGRLAWASLPDDPGQAVAALERAQERAGTLITVVAGPRPSEFDRLLAREDPIVLVPPRDAPPALLELAVESLGDLRVPVAICRPLAGAVRAAALAGLVRVPVPDLGGEGGAFLGARVEAP